jgi:hypothetical protein
MMAFLPMLLGNPWARLAAAVTITGLLGFSYGFLKGHERANAAYWQELARVAKEAAITKERIAKQDADRAETAETALAQSQAQLESLLHDTKSSCRLSGPELDGLRQLAAGERRRK